MLAPISTPAPNPVSNPPALSQRLSRVFGKLSDHGVTLELTERHTIRAVPADRLNDDLRQTIRQHRDLLIEYLMAQRLATVGATGTAGAGGAGTAAATDTHHAAPLSPPVSPQSVLIGTHARMTGDAAVSPVGAEGGMCGGNGLPGPSGASSVSSRSLVLARPPMLDGNLIYVAPNDTVGVGFQYLAPNNPARATYPVYFRSELPLIREMGEERFAAFHPQRVALLALWEPWVGLTDWELVALGKQAGIGRYATLQVVEHLRLAGLAMEWVVWNTLQTTLLRPQHNVGGR